MFEDIHSTKKTRILSLVALQTLKTTTGDDNLGLRIQVNFDEILQHFSEYITSIKVIDFFEFIYDFIQRFHAHFTKDNLQIVLNALVLRITTEHQMRTAPAKKTLDLRQNKVKKSKGPNKKSLKNSEIIINKCWSVIRIFAENQFFCNSMVPIIEQTTRPLLMMIN